MENSHRERSLHSIKDRVLSKKDKEWKDKIDPILYRIAEKYHDHSPMRMEFMGYLKRTCFKTARFEYYPTSATIEVEIIKYMNRQYTSDGTKEPREANPTYRLITQNKQCGVGRRGYIDEFYTLSDFILTYSHMPKREILLEMLTLAF